MEIFSWWFWLKMSWKWLNLSWRWNKCDYLQLRQFQLFSKKKSFLLNLLKNHFNKSQEVILQVIMFLFWVFCFFLRPLMRRSNDDFYWHCSNVFITLCRLIYSSRVYSTNFWFISIQIEDSLKNFLFLQLYYFFWWISFILRGVRKFILIQDLKMFHRRVEFVSF